MKLNIKSVLFLGVGGISMHQLAIAFKQMGAIVYGYDAKKSKYTEICKNNGVEFTTKFNADFCNVDLCITTGAIKSNKYLNVLKSKGIKVVDRAEILGWFCKQFKTVIAVAGTHGKSTTASLIYEVLKYAGKKVSCHIGAEVYSPRFELGDDYLVVEACEYNKSFLKIHPNIAVVTNVEAEHMDSYSSMFCLKSAFLTFLKRARKRYVFKCKSTKFLSKCKNVTNVLDCNLKLNPQIKGEYNLNNINLAIKVCQDVGVSDNDIVSVVNKFKGVARRYEFIGEFNKTKIFIDYAHHPTEIKNFVSAFSNEFKNFLIIFQPHTYSRTKMFLKDFCNVLSKIDNLIIFKEYAAREKSIAGLTSKELYYKVKEFNEKVEYSSNIKKVENVINKYSAVAFVGAGDINLIAQKLLSIK